MFAYCLPFSYALFLLLRAAVTTRGATFFFKPYILLSYMVAVDFFFNQRISIFADLHVYFK